jgi:hypothetical protein
LLVFHRSFVDGHGSFRHHVHGVPGRQKRQLLEANLHDDFGDGFLDLTFELFDGLGVLIVTNRISSF